MKYADLNAAFETVFESQPSATYFAPGRINLIGEHIDYNGGHVFPCAITFGTYALIRKRDDQICNFYSMNFESLGVISVSLDAISYDETDDWVNYPKGVIKMLADTGHPIESGFDVLYYGNIPNGAGLSSSASLEVLTATFINEMYQLGVSRLDTIKLSQRAENEFVGVNSGIMDQFAVGMGQKDAAILLNTNTLDYEIVPVILEDASIVIMNTNKRRGLIDSAYNTRREECDAAFRIIKEYYDVQFICDLSMKQLLAIQTAFADDVIWRRAKHAVSENERTLEATSVLKAGNINRFGELMNESHVSLRDDYEVTGLELDTLVEKAWRVPGTIGARVTGAGFGGCAIAIVPNDAIAAFKDQVGEHYRSVVGYDATFHVATIGQGVHRLD